VVVVVTGQAAVKGNTDIADRLPGGGLLKCCGPGVAGVTAGAIYRPVLSRKRIAGSGVIEERGLVERSLEMAR